MSSMAYTTTVIFEDSVEQTRIQRFALLGILAAAIGTGCAVFLIPTDPTPQGALFDPALAMTAGLIVAPLAVACRYPESLLRAENLLAVAPIYWLLLDLLQGAYPLEGVAPEHVNTAFRAIGAFVMAMWAGAYARPWRFPQSIVKSASLDISGETFFRLSVAAFILGMLKFAIPTNFNVFEMFSYIGSGRWSAPWVRGQLGGWDAFQDQLQYFGYLLPALTVVIARRFGWVHRKTIVTVGMSSVMILFLMQSGSRRIIGVMCSMALILWMLTEQRLRLRNIIVGIGAVALLLLTLQLMVEHRNLGLGSLAAQAESEPLFEEEYIHVDDNVLRLSQVIELIPEYYPYVSYEYIVWVLARPIPRVLWPGKPVDPGFDLPTALGIRGVSLTFSVVGELYMSAGFIGIALGGFLYGRFARMATQLLTKDPKPSALIIYAILTMSLFAGVRSMLDLVLMNYTLIAWVALTLLYIHFKGRSVSGLSSIMTAPRV